MFLRFVVILATVLISTTHGKLGISALARCIMAEAPLGNKVEQTAIGFACPRNPNHGSNRNPYTYMIRVAQDINAGRVSDPSKEANRWYSPYSMPKEAESAKCKQPIGKGTVDCGGGLENPCGTTKNYKPSWVVSNKQVTVAGARDCYYKLFKM